MREFGIFILILVIIGILGAIYYFYIYKPSHIVGASGTNTVTSTGSLPVIGSVTPVYPWPHAGDSVYLNPNAPVIAIGYSWQHLSGVPIYSYPDVTNADFLVGLTKHVWSNGKQLGTYVEQASNGFSKVTLTGVKAYAYPTNLSNPQTTLTGDYFIRTSYIQKTPY